MIRIIRALVLVAAVISIAIAAALWWVLGTNSGARWTFEQIPRFTPVALEAGSIQGTLAGTLTITGLEAAWPGGTGRVRETKMQWQPLALLSGRIVLTEFMLSGLNVQDNRPETAPAQPGFSWPTTEVSLPPALIRIRTLALDDVVYQRRGQARIRINRARADVLITPGTLSFRNMSVRTPQLAIKGTVAAGLREPRLKTDITLTPGNPLSGMDGFRVRTNLLPADLPALMSGQVLAEAYAQSSVKFELETRITLSHRSLRIKSMDLSETGRTGRLTGTGELVFGKDPPVFEGTAVLHGLDLSKEVPKLNNINGSISIKGNVHDYQGSFSLVNKGDGWKSGKLEAGFRGTSRTLDLLGLKAAFLDGSITGSGRADWTNKPFFSAELRARGINPEAAAPSWSGSLNMNLTGELRMAGKKQPSGSLSLRLLRSSLKGQRFTGRGKARLQQGRIRLEHLAVTGETFSLKAEGDVAERLNFSIRLADLSLLRKEAQGRAHAQGWIRKQDRGFSGSIQAYGSALLLHGFRAGSLEVRAVLEQAGEGPFSLRISGRDCGYHAVRIDTLLLEASGTPVDHRIRASLRSTAASVKTAVSGAFTDSTWTGTIKQFSGTDMSGSWKAREQASLIVSKNGFSISPLRLAAGAGEQVELQADIKTLPLSGSFLVEWRGLNISRVNAWIKEVQLSGSASGRISGTIHPETRLDLTAEASLSGARIIRRMQGIELKAEIKKADLAVAWQNRTMNGKAVLILEQYGQIKGEFRLPLPARLPVSPEANGPVQAAITGQVRETGTLSLLFPGVLQESRGQIAMDIRVAGTWQSPEVTGSANMTNAGAYFPAAGIHVSEIQANVVIEKEILRVTSFSAVSGPGKIQGKGKIDLEGFRPVRYDGTLQGERFQALFLPHVRMLISPEIEFQGTLRKLTARGVVRVPELLIYGAPRGSSIQASEDVIIIGADQEEDAAARMIMDLELKVILGDRVIVKTEGIDARLGGEVLVTARALNEVTGKGEIKVIKGKYSIYGISLNIERGRLFFAGGPVANPTLDILALKTVNEVKAGVQVSGPLKKPVVRLSSEPAMPDADVLAYIILGHPLGQDKEQGSLLMKAAAALLSAGQSVALQDQIKNRLGIDTIDIQAGEGEVARSLVTIGKYLSSRLYISYGYALFTGESLFKLRYKFGRNWELESRSGQASGVDLYYTVQFD